MSDKPHAVVICIMRDRQILMVRRSPSVPSPGYWCPVSGKLEPEETQLQAVCREAQEEVGVTVQPEICFRRSMTHDERYVLHWWTARLLKGEPQVNCSEVNAVMWVTADGIKTLNPMFSEDRHIIQTLFDEGSDRVLCSSSF